MVSDTDLCSPGKLSDPRALHYMFEGSSDPYCVFIIDGKTQYTSRKVFKTLNPSWDESFALSLSDLSKHIVFQVYDYDQFSRDDFMGQATIDVSMFEINA